MWYRYFCLPLATATIIFANPFLHERLDVITTRSLKKRLDEFDSEPSFSNDGETLADDVPQNVISSSSTDPNESPYLTFDDSTTLVNIDSLVADCPAQDTTDTDHNPARKRGMPKPVCPVRERTQAPKMGMFNFKNFDLFRKRPDSNVQRSKKPRENPCVGQSVSLDGVSQSVHVSCGGPKVGVVGIRSDYVLNCLPG